MVYSMNILIKESVNEYINLSQYLLLSYIKKALGLFPHVFSLNNFPYGSTINPTEFNHIVFNLRYFSLFGCFPIIPICFLLYFKVEFREYVILEILGIQECYLLF